MMFGLNISEEDLINNVENDYVKKVKEYAKTIKADCVTFLQKLNQNYHKLKMKKKD